MISCIKFFLPAWSSAGNTHATRYEQTASVLTNEKMLVTGQSKKFIQPYHCELYDPSTGIWNITGPLNHPRYSH
jgi:hypothetical protein